MWSQNTLKLFNQADCMKTISGTIEVFPIMSTVGYLNVRHLLFNIKSWRFKSFHTSISNYLLKNIKTIDSARKVVILQNLTTRGQIRLDTFKKCNYGKPPVQTEQKGRFRQKILKSFSWQVREYPTTFLEVTASYNDYVISDFFSSALSLKNHCF